MADKSKSLREKLVEMLPESLTKRAVTSEQQYQKRQKEAIDIAFDENTDTSKGTDAGELGKKWDEEFK